MLFAMGLVFGLFCEELEISFDVYISLFFFVNFCAYEAELLSLMNK